MISTKKVKALNPETAPFGTQPCPFNKGNKIAQLKQSSDSRNKAQFGRKLGSENTTV